MQAVVLAGGLATRLRPRTEQLPKSLLSVADRPFLAWQLDKLRTCGFSEVVLCIGHLGKDIRAFAGDGSRFGVSLRYSEDGPVLLGTGGALRHALPLLAATFLVTYGDSYLPFDYAGPLRDLQEHPEAAGSLAVYANRGRWDASNTQVLGQRVLRYAKGSRDPALDHIDYGALALRRDVLATYPAGSVFGLESVQGELAGSGRLRAFLAGERFYEIGSEQGLLDLEAYLTSLRRFGS